MDVTVTFRKKTRCHKAWIIRGYVYLRSTFAKCCWKRQASRFASATSVLIYSSLSDRPTRLDHSLDGICPLPGLFLPELAVSQLPHTKVGTTAAPGTFCTQRMGKLQMPWGQDPFTDCEAAWLKARADWRKEPEAGCNTPERGMWHWTQLIRAGVALPSKAELPVLLRCLQLAHTAPDAAAAASLAPAAAHRDALLVHPPPSSEFFSISYGGSQPCKLMFLMATNRNK